MRQIGTHLLVELVGCRFDHLDDLEIVQRAMIAAARKARATVLDASFHRFSPQGVSGVVVLAESHISVHTWPESGYAAVDVFTCGDRTMPHRAAEYLIEALQPSHYDIKEMPRGIPEPHLKPVPAEGYSSRQAWQELA